MIKEMNKKIILLLLLLTVTLMGLQEALAYSGYLGTFETTYPVVNGTRIDNCALCHVNPAGGGTRTSYGEDFRIHGHNFTAIEPLDSDSDGFTNIVEIRNLTFPGNPNDHPALPVLTTITVTPAPAAVFSGFNLTFIAEGRDQYRNPIAISPAVFWSSSNITVGTISATGVFTALLAGTTTITARNGTSGSVSGAAAVTIVSAPGNNTIQLHLGTAYVPSENCMGCHNVLNEISLQLNITTPHVAHVLSGSAPVEAYTYVTGNTTTSGTVANFANMQSAADSGAYATLAEGGSGGGGSSWQNGADSYTVTRGTVENFTNMIDNNTATSGTITETKFGAKFGTNVAFNWSTLSSADYYNLTIYYGIDPTNQENYRVNVWNYGTSSYVTLGTLSSTNTTWLNISLSPSHINGTNVQVQIVSLSDVNGEPQDNLRIYEISIKGDTTGSPTTYSLNITTDTALVPGANNHSLEINYSVAADDNYYVYIFDGSTWNNRGTLNSASWAVFNYTLTSSEYNSGAPRIRYIDQNPSGTAQGSLYIDYQRIHSVSSVVSSGIIKFECNTCHRSVDLNEDSSAALRRQVDPGFCAECHLPFSTKMPPENKNMSCTACHSGWKEDMVNATFVDQSSVTSNDCYGCHGGRELYINSSVVEATGVIGTVSGSLGNIAGAIVATNTGVNTTTDANGFYSLSLVNGTYQLTASKEPEYYSNSSVTVTVTDTTITQDIILALKPTGTISGAVISLSGT